MGRHPPFPWSAWAIHALTASGAALAFLALLEVIAGDVKSALLWLGVAALVDGIDGPLARRFRVRDRVPGFDGAALDLIVDYLTYVFVPAVMLWRFGMLPDGWVLAGCLVVLLTSLHLFAKTDMKLADNHFQGFPSIWNGVVLAFVVLSTGPWVNLAVVLFLGALTFAPVAFVHPFRVTRFRAANIPATLVLLAASAWLVAVLPDRPGPVLAVWLACAGWLGGVSVWRTLGGDRGRGG